MKPPRPASPSRRFPGILVDPRVMGGAPVIQGTRIPVVLILEMLEGGNSFESIKAQYPRLTDENIRSAIRYCSKAIRPA